MKVGILGSGGVAQALALGFLKYNHDLMLGTRDPAKLAEWIKKNPKAKVGSLDQTAKFADLIVLAVNPKGAEPALKSASVENLAGKPVIDLCNPIADVPPVNGVLTFFTDFKESFMEKLQKQFPTVHFVKAFNSVGSALMVDPKFKEGKPTMFFCGNDPAAKQTVSKIIEQFGFEPADMGKAEAARAIEPLCILWIIPGLLNNQWNHAFKLLKA
jgi:predicted dinucleotide-binding enzyme